MASTDKKGLLDRRHDNAFMSAIAQASLDALITIDSAGKIIEFSPVAEKMFGYERSEVLGVPVSEIVIPSHLRQAHEDGMKKYHKTGQGPVINTRIEVPAVRRNGEEFPAELTVVPMEIGGEKLFTAFVRDISELKAHENEINLARQQAEQANIAKSRFLAHMSHELRSPLTTVLGAVDLLLESSLDKSQSRFANMAKNSGESLLDLISDILDFSRIESGNLELNTDWTDLHALISSISEGASRKARDKGIDMAEYIAPDVPRTVECDSVRLRQILANFLDNAIKFTHKGGVALHVENHETDSQEVQLKFSVHDSGIGISADKSQTVFNEFMQVDSSDSTAYSGAGLGLSIVKLLADKMDAEVGIESVENKGSEFWLKIRLPYKAGSKFTDCLPEAIQIMSLIDNPVTADVLNRQIEDMGARNIIRTDISGLHEKEARDIDLFIIDMNSLGMSCEDVLNEATQANINKKRICFLIPPDEQEKLSLQVADTAGTLTTPVQSYWLYKMANQALWSKGSDATENPIDQTTVVKKRILLAEDSPSNQEIISAMLRSGGYEVTVASNGEEAVQAVKDNDYDLVLMDMRMPIMDGIESTRQIRNLGGKYENQLIIALTANALQEDIDRCLAAGMNDFHTKPVKKEALLGKISSHLSDSTAR